MRGADDFLCLQFYLPAVVYLFGQIQIAGLVKQPHHSSTRCVVGAWLLMSFVLYATYTANLTAFLTVSRHVLPFGTLEEMAAQSEYKYGAAEGTVTKILFEVYFKALTNTFDIKILADVVII